MTHSTLGCWINWIPTPPRLLAGSGGWVGVSLVLYIMNHVVHHILTPPRLLAGREGGWVGVYPVLYIMNHVIHHIPTPPRLLAGNGVGCRSLSCPLDYEPRGSSYSNSTTPASREGWGVGGNLSCPLYYEPRGSS